jgi:hypothetical protein
MPDQIRIQWCRFLRILSWIFVIGGNSGWYGRVCCVPQVEVLTGEESDEDEDESK